MVQFSTSIKLAMPNHNIPTTGFHTNPERINKDGRPPAEWTWSGLLKQKLEECPPGDKRQYKELVAESLRLKALEGDVQAIKEFGNRIDGMPEQSVKQSGELKITYKPIMGATASVPEDPVLPQTTQTNEAD